MNASAEPEVAALSAATLLRNTATIRERANALLVRARAGRSDWFVIGDDAALERTAQIVADVTRERYGDGPIPYHSRWRHFEAGGVDRRAELQRLRGHVDYDVSARSQIDLTIVSVLLDAGAGADWKYWEEETGQSFTRSEGLGVASFRAFVSGMFSSNPRHPLRVDAAGLHSVTTSQLATAFQVSNSNPIIGLEGRVSLLHRLGDTLPRWPDYYGQEGRPGELFHALAGKRKQVAVPEILAVLLTSLSDVWLAPNQLDDETTLGDCWRHSAVRGEGMSEGWMPFHKLSQWLTYSLIEPFERAGVQVTGLSALTGLPEYRNGGLLLDAGVIVPKDVTLLDRTWQVGDEFVVEWRALTVALLDELAPRVRKILGKTEAEMPLACVLEGGTWAAGRVLAQHLRGGASPIKIASDGTVF